MSDTSERADRYVRGIPARHPDDYRPQVSHSPALSATMLRLRVSRLEAENEALRDELAVETGRADEAGRANERLAEVRSRDRERLAWAIVAALVLAGLLALQFLVR